MLIDIHMIQNHSAANLNRDDLGAPKTCHFGGVLRSRISSQCIKRSIRMSDEFNLLCGSIRTRRLPQCLAAQIKDTDALPLATSVVQKCGVLETEEEGTKKDVIVFLSKSAVARMVDLLRGAPAQASQRQVTELARQFAELIANDRYAPDMALSGRMLEPAKGAKEVWEKLDTTVEAALQVAHAISTHEARPEVDYFVARDDVPGEDPGGAHIGEAMFGSACFYKYFSVHWETLLRNLNGFNGNKEHLAAHTVGAFIRGAALVNPTGKQNSFAAHNPPDGMLIEIRDAPISYANAFAKPAAQGERDIISQSIAQLGQYVRDLDVGYGQPKQRFWFSPNLRYPLTVTENNEEIALTENNARSLDQVVPAVLGKIGDGYDWNEVRKVVVHKEASS